MRVQLRVEESSVGEVWESNLGTKLTPKDLDADTDLPTPIATNLFINGISPAQCESQIEMIASCSNSSGRHSKILLDSGNRCSFGCNAGQRMERAQSRIKAFMSGSNGICGARGMQSEMSGLGT